VPDWLEQARRRLESGIDDVGDLALSAAEVGLLLELARRAAHDSGARTNAPLVCYLVGLAVGRSGAVTPAQAIEILERETSS
jgi:hypothetical protein